MKKLAVIYYHDIVDPGMGYSYQKTEERHFEEQMRFLSENGYNTILMEDLEKPLPDKAVLITFDDGFISVYRRAVPIMQKYGVRGNILLPTKYIEDNDPRFMSWEQLKEVCGSGAFSVAAHTHTHTDIRTLDDSGMKSETESSRKAIQEHLGKDPKSFCMPFGKYNKSSIKLLKKYGKYSYIFSSYYGLAAESVLTNKLIPRIGISNDDTIGVFADKLNGKLNWKGPLQRMRLTLENLKGERITRYDIE